MPRKTQAQHTLGCGNQGKYSDVPSDLFCGPNYCPKTFPVNSQGRINKAWALWRNHPNKLQLAECIFRKAHKQGLTPPMGVLKFLHEHYHKRKL